MGATFNIIKGPTNNFTAVWVKDNKMYITSSGVLNVIDLSNNTLYDYYDQTIKGRADECLNNDNIIDVGVN